MNEIEKTISNMIVSDNYCVLSENEQWDGFSNNLDLLEAMKKLGWEFIHSDKYIIDGYGNIANRTYMELIFKRIKNDKN